jgi:hypothetical protein
VLARACLPSGEIIRATSEYAAADRLLDRREKSVVNKFDDPLLAPQEATRHLLTPRATMYYWSHDQVNSSHSCTGRKNRSTGRYVAAVRPPTP